MPDDRASVVAGDAVEWWRAVTDALGSAMENREDAIAGAPAVLASNGAIGHAVYAEPTAEVRAVFSGILDRINGLRDPPAEAMCNNASPVDVG